MSTAPNTNVPASLVEALIMEEIKKIDAEIKEEEKCVHGWDLCTLDLLRAKRAGLQIAISLVSKARQMEERAEKELEYVEYNPLVHDRHQAW